ncbi:hypothetical protein HME9302_00701 [Alteripontixanthobacter maritimus]|uniref:Uncharacterized protein n=1 Tax=Alteripontixanthobacter maritimus TaxID=2161824 RepID=A0A369Q3P7_9SPHN|nr:hypothetical protein [Alteripontixanthobacter maritimus]RDC59511.1 hypothetical protein HME9302_00701 [Alteripontixanthobacter maritimus]
MTAFSNRITAAVGSLAISAVLLATAILPATQSVANSGMIA